MLQVTPHMRVLVCVQPVDFRKGIDAIAAICRNLLKEDPHNGTLFLFRNRSRCSLRILMYDEQGFWLSTKRLSRGKFPWWSTSTSESVDIPSWALQTLLSNGNPSTAGFGKEWRKLPISSIMHA